MDVVFGPYIVDASGEPLYPLFGKAYLMEQ